MIFVTVGTHEQPLDVYKRQVYKGESNNEGV